MKSFVFYAQIVGDCLPIYLFFFFCFLLLLVDVQMKKVLKFYCQLSSIIIFYIWSQYIWQIWNWKKKTVKKWLWMWNFQRRNRMRNKNCNFYAMYAAWKLCTFSRFFLNVVNCLTKRNVFLYYIFNWRKERDRRRKKYILNRNLFYITLPAYDE